MNEIDNDEFYPTLFEIHQKVDMMRAYVACPFYANSIFGDLRPFMDMVNADFAELNNFESRLGQQGLKDSERADLDREVGRLKQKLLACFRYFESAHQVYLRGTYADFAADHQYGMSYVGNIRTILQVLNYSVRNTFESLGFNWSGFVTFSNFLSHQTAEASIMVLPFSAKRTVEFVSDWLLITHEMGHVFFWEYLMKKAVGAAGPSKPGTPKLVSELLADFFSLEQGYAMDVLHLCGDFDRVRRHFQDPAAIKGFREYHQIRQVATLLYCCARVDSAFAARMKDVASQPSNQQSVIVTFLRDEAAAIAEVIQSTSCVKLDTEYYRQFVEFKFAKPTLDAVRSWYMTERKLINRPSAEHMERQFLDFVADFALGSYAELKSIQISDPMSAQQVSDCVMSVIEGEVVLDHIEKPFVFIKQLLDRCERLGIHLEDDRSASIRTAAILSLFDDSLRASHGGAGLEAVASVD